MIRTSLTVIDTPSRELTATGFWVTHIGHASGGPTYQNPGRIIADHLLLLTVAGEGWSGIAHRSGPLAPGDLTLLPAGVEHRFGCGPTGRWDFLYAHINGPAVEPLLAWWPGFATDHYSITAPLEETSRQMVAAVTELQDRRAAYGLAAAGYVQQAIRTAIVHGRRDSAPERQDSPASVAQRYVDSHLEQRLTLEGIAHHVHISPSYLSRLFKQATGFSPMEYVIKQRINRAKDLLHTTDLPVAAIARRCGYDDAGYFARMFRNQTGVSPSAYRNTSLTPSSSLSEH